MLVCSPFWDFGCRDYDPDPLKKAIRHKEVRRYLAQVIMGEKSTFVAPINNQMNCILQFR